MEESSFILPIDDYKRRIDPLPEAIQQAATFLHLRTNEPIEVCIDFIRTSLKSKSFPTLKDPNIHFYERQENGDREKKVDTLMNYIYSSIRNQEIIAPTFTTYKNPKVEESVTSLYTTANIKIRNTAKKAEFAAKARYQSTNNPEDYLTSIFKNNEQTNAKLDNNAVSGGFVTSSTPLFNKTAHSTLTSGCRNTSGFGNANNEKITCGNRHYWNSEIVINNILSIINNVDYKAIEEVVNKYNLHIPSVGEVMEVIHYSTNLYWINKKLSDNILALVESLNPLQRVAFVYVGDLYHIKKFNDSFIRIFLERLGTKVISKDEYIDTGIAHKLNEAELLLAHSICMDEVKGLGKDYNEMLKAGVFSTLISTAKNINNTLIDYKDFIRTFFTTSNLPASVAYFPNSIRRSALTSDTDSTIFTVQDWVTWYNPNKRHPFIRDVVVFFASQAITHVLATMSANFGIEKSKLLQISMKNEYTFPVFIPTQVAKHYYANKSVQEGNVFKVPEREIKGVHLKNSNSPKKVIKAATEMMENILDAIDRDEKISIISYLTRVADMEREIIKSLKNGDLEFYRMGKIKDPKAYTKSKEDSPYQHYTFWEETFRQKYGPMPPAPLITIKVPTILDKKQALNKWLDEMKDKELSDRLRTYFNRKGKSDMKTMYLSADLVKGNGLPEEIFEIFDSRKIARDLCSVFYLVLETLGYYKKVDSLISDTY